MQNIIEKLEAFLEWGGIRREWTVLALSALALVASLCGWSLGGVDLAWVAIVLCGIPIILEAIIGLVTAFDIKADVLVALALIAAVIIGEIFAAGEVAFIMQLGALLEDLTVSRARAGMERLVDLSPTTARVLRNGTAETIPATEVKQGDILQVFAGEILPVDGVITQGDSSIDQSVVTGESLPVDKTMGDEVFSGTLNQYGTFEMEATKVGEDSSVQRMIRLVQSADASKAKIVGLADRWATWIVVLALTFAVCAYVFTGEIIRAVTVLVVFCPCALVLATPTAIMAAIGNVSKYGFLVREGDALEKLAQVQYITFDKTGTLTLGKPTVSHISAFAPLTEAGLFSLTASAELRSEHPLGKALLDAYRKQHGAVIPPDAFQMFPGKGVRAEVQGQVVLAGNVRLLEQHGISLEGKTEALADAQKQAGASVLWVAVDGVLAGFIALRDSLRTQAKETIAGIQNLGIVPLLLTGDAQAAAQQVAKETNISQVVAQCLPEDKLAEIQTRQAEGARVCMVGDGINDAPALKLADVGIAMGGIGSDVAVDAADIALINDDIAHLPHLLALSKRMMRVIKLNMGFSLGLNFLAIALAFTGILNPVVGALVHNAGSVFVILCSATLLHWHKK